MLKVQLDNMIVPVSVSVAKSDLVSVAKSDLVSVAKSIQGPISASVLANPVSVAKSVPGQLPE